ncbi:DUF4192 domain-containing protein [Cellulomonas fimi]|uniref:DUF4192 domain-containing protein n=1 Tax=Cellulomonas fimi (strain ATCC 484 / DSM 20113 / JCM 1341 / CCUG 24087 / LMG 16345 / NBRC 15513 / NCIMB 8980 / NCTC 7547 / NRS-133) TaxID=590998 RepID=F4H1J3_CELFA|nr:DUF4192 domain-containing protein [Cellulomonas fimi]AEE46292.1 hypothetical protein Celf_2164 [Cellulomonas fimi ATCC 484]NNH06230.1 DUF4192 family protein [Cellulomonas fimi]VEH32400.1 Uncharacterised protein [Cellulomonas fimi]
MDTTTLRVSEPRELLALVPHRLGFRPRESVVAVSLRPPRGTVGLVVRADVDALADPVEGGARARALVALLDDDGARRALLVVYTDHDPRLGPAAAGAAVHRAVDVFREAAAVALGEVHVWVVCATGYLALDCAQDCCPPGGRPLRELDATQTGARLVLAGSAVAESRDALARIPPADAERRRGTARSRRRWEGRHAEALAAGPEDVARWRAGCVSAWRRAVATQEAVIAREGATDGRDGDADVPAPVGGENARAAGRGGAGAVVAAPWGHLEAGLRDRRVRDAVLVSFVGGDDDLPERSVQVEPLAPAVHAEVGAAVAAIVDPARSTPPPPSPCAGERALEQVVAHGRTGHQAPALTLLAVLAWWRGDGARAAVLLDRALEDEPQHTLALLVHALLAAAVAPGWLRRAG